MEYAYHIVQVRRKKSILGFFSQQVLEPPMSGTIFPPGVGLTQAYLLTSSTSIRALHFL